MHDFLISFLSDESLGIGLGIGLCIGILIALLVIAFIVYIIHKNFCRHEESESEESSNSM